MSHFTLPKLRNIYKRGCYALGLCLVTGLSAFAQTGNAAGAAALQKASEDIAKYVEPTQKVIYAIAGVVALVGAISVFVKMNNEEQDVKKSIMMVVGSCVFLVIAASALPLFFK